jgi:hypothetical protein
MSQPASASAARGPVDERVLIPLALLALYVIWGSTYLGIRYALESYPPFLLAGVRFLGAGVLYGFLRLRGLAAPTARQWRNAAFTGVLLLGFGNGLVCFAEQRVARASPWRRRCAGRSARRGAAARTCPPAR